MRITNLKIFILFCILSFSIYYVLLKFNWFDNKNQIWESNYYNSNQNTFKYDKKFKEHIASEEKTLKKINNDTIKACILIYATNNNLNTLKSTIISFEKMFNRKFNYPYILFNNEKFTNEFKSEIVKHSHSKIEFVIISTENWNVPDWVDVNQLEKIHHNAYYSYIFYNRFFSGFFFKEEVTLKYDYYLRIDHRFIFPCPINQDPFLKLYTENILYGYLISSNKDTNKISKFWKEINQWLDNGIRDSIPKINLMKNITDNNRVITNECYFESNFEIASFNLFRNDLYSSYFNHLDRSGAFFFDMVDDSLVHSYFAFLMLNKDEIIKFNDIGFSFRKKFKPPVNGSILCLKNEFDLYSDSCTIL